MKTKKKSIRLWAVVFWLLVWQGASMALAALYPHGALLLASPLSALARLGELAVTAAFWRTALTSAARILGGFLLACALAVVLAALAARYRRAEELLAPLVSVVKAVPVASFIILALVWLDSRRLPLFIAALLAFPVVYRNVLEGIRGTSRELLEMAQVFRIPLSRRLRGVDLPQVLPISARRPIRRWAFRGRPARRRRSSACAPAPSANGSTPPRSTFRPLTSSRGRR